MTIEINGMAHVILTVSRFDVARDFYRKLLPQFGMKPVFDGDKFLYCVGGRTAIGIEPCDPALASESFQQQRVGLHHLCLRARSREDVDLCATVLKEMAAIIMRGSEEGNWAPGYYHVLSRIPTASGWRCALSQARSVGGWRVVRSLRRLYLRLGLRRAAADIVNLSFSAGLSGENLAAG
jgi:catechol 2,3-dioxygenase-like lactoylglutathione lyase family enzyme